MEYYFPGFPGIGKKSRDKNTGQNDTGSREPGIPGQNPYFQRKPVVVVVGQTSWPTSSIREK